MRDETPQAPPYARLPQPQRLRPLIGAGTGLLIGTGVAIGSGIFRNTGLLAEQVQTPLWMLACWLLCGVYFTLAGLLTAELATRFPRAGGEYVFLRHAYGDFVAFFFGWAYTIFVAGNGVAIMAIAFGDFAAQLLHLSDSQRHSGWIGSLAVIAVTAINLRGLRTGAATQNVLTLLKVAALLAIVGLAVFLGRPVDWLGHDTVTDGATAAASASAAAASRAAAPRGAGLLALLPLFAAAMMPVMWCYEGTTDSVKMTEETRDPRRSMPRSLIGANLLVTTVYLLVNWAFLRGLTPAEMANSNAVHADLLARWIGPAGGMLSLLLAMAVVAGALSSTIVSTVRVPFALGRDGFTFRALGRMSPTQSPDAALLVVAAIAVAFSLSGVYKDVLSIYTIATGVLFGLVNLSLIVFRLRDRRDRRGGERPDAGRDSRMSGCEKGFSHQQEKGFSHQQGRTEDRGDADHFRCPAGILVSLLLAGMQFVIAAGTAWQEPKLALYTLATLAALAALYVVWPRPTRTDAA